jgi:hypothetical protein
VLLVAAEWAYLGSVQTVQGASGHQPILPLTAPVAAAVLAEQTVQPLTGFLHMAPQAVFMAAEAAGA